MSKLWVAKKYAVGNRVKKSFVKEKSVIPLLPPTNCLPQSTSDDIAAFAAYNLKLGKYMRILQKNYEDEVLGCEAAYATIKSPENQIGAEKFVKKELVRK